ncbi:acyl-CoA dehydrogenase [Pseudomaricurvus alkylphenolicus]|uniref:acyl-CoA dehydrogenase family protein n=1 Tax=Pseudomaricurvus alkylphenolicus TaxID=1306991 RepID=UPI00141F9DE6|nr:acyl-CoA dehydrogenase family protein [Pseudomaricurvus alkylphenolicus]NIB40080.1 acyl-CoA dehydrogenase [Pseudomaricurvus alkylphenolicus]
MSQFADRSELQLFRDNVKRYIQDKILPHYEGWEKAEIFPREVWNQLGEQGFLAVDVPEEYGGYGSNYEFSMVVAEEFCRSNCGALGGPMIVHSDIVAHYILNNGTEEQKQKYLPRMVSGECIGAVAMTEPGAGSDLQGIRTTAKRDGDDYIINGSKTFITNGQHGDVVVVVAKTNLDVPGAKGTTLFLVDSDTPGFSRGRNLEKIGLHASDTSELFFEDVRVPASAILGQLDAGFAVLMGELQRERLSLAISAVAAAEGILDETVAYVNERQAFGAPIAQLQNTKFKMAEMATDVRVNKAFTEECKRSFIEGTLDVATVSMAKLSTTEMQNRVADGCLQLHGGYGYMREYGVSRAFVDARIQRIYGGTSEIMKELISRSVLSA